MLAVNGRFPACLRGILIFFYCVILLPAMLGCGALNVIAQPAATQTPTSSSTPSPTPTLTPQPTLTATPTKAPVVCGGPPAMFILLIGSDSRRDNYSAGLADAIRLVRVDFIEPRALVLPFPRDLYVEIPGIESDDEIRQGKINQAYLYGNTASDDRQGQGPGLLALTLQHNFGAYVDHHLAVNLQSLVRIVDELGGIDIDLPYVVDGRVPGSKDPNRYFPAGEQHLNGYRTMLLARMRPQGDLQRIEVQSLILQSLAEKLFSLVGLREFPALIETFRESVQTDLGPVEIGQLLCLATKLDVEEIEFVSFPEDLFKSERVRDPVLGNTSALTANFDLMKIYVQRFIHGNWPQPHETPRERIGP